MIAYYCDKCHDKTKAIFQIFVDAHSTGEYRNEHLCRDHLKDLLDIVPDLMDKEPRTSNDGVRVFKIYQ